MQALIQIQSGDRQLLAGITDVTAEGECRSGDWVVCRRGRTPSAYP